MQVTTHLAFDGNCREAFQTYERILGGKIVFMMTNGESPMADKVPPTMKDKVMHASLQIPGGGSIQGGDHPEGKAVKPTGFSVCVTVKDKAEGERIFKGLSEGGQVQMPYEKTFWSPGFGMCIDKFSVPWMVNTQGDMAPA
ncbi:MAG TPA: VOC family protein [Acidobacteriaceae bacterium]|nr:VOC family protein [Acidobacteriaceae bacterium]